MWISIPDPLQVTSNYVLGGGDGYTMLEEGGTNHVIGDLDTDVIKRVGVQLSSVETVDRQ